MSRSYRTGDEKFNIIMESFQNPDIPIAEICREHGIAVSLFYKWKEQFIEGGKKGLEGNNKIVNNETTDLKRIIADLTIANDALKKTLQGRRK